LCGKEQQSDDVKTQTISQDVNNTGPEALPVSVCNCFLYFTCKENIL